MLNTTDDPDENSSRQMVTLIKSHADDGCWYWWRRWWPHCLLFPGHKSSCLLRVCSALTRTSTPSRNTWETSWCRSGWGIYVYIYKACWGRKELMEVKGVECFSWLAWKMWVYVKFSVMASLLSICGKNCSIVIFSDTKYEKCQTLHDGSTHWALPIPCISRSQRCQTVLTENFMFSSK